MHILLPCYTTCMLLVHAHTAHTRAHTHTHIHIHARHTRHQNLYKKHRERYILYTMPRVTFCLTPANRPLTKTIGSKSSKAVPRPRKSILKKKHPLTGLVPRKQLKEWRKEVCGDFEMFFYKNQSVCTKDGDILCVSVSEHTGSLLSI